jgi:coenzyme F420 hydrogenase subunit beta
MVSALSARSVGVVKSDEPNDVIQGLLVAAHSAGLIDGAVGLDVDPWTLEPVARVASTVDEIVSGLGMQHLWAPISSALNRAVFEVGLKRLAIVGTPCVAEGIRRLLDGGNERLRPYRQAIRTIISCFCTGVYMPGMVVELIERGMGISRQQIREMSVSVETNTLTVSLWDDTERTIPMTAVKPFTRHGCGSCDDYLGRCADVAVGTVGARPGYATVIVHTESGQALVQNALRFGLLESIAEVDEAALETARAEKDRRARARAFDEFRILTLEALSDPHKRAEVRQRFVSLYGLSQPGDLGQEVCDVSCSGC